jgi:hypothetical protein
MDWHESYEHKDLIVNKRTNLIIGSVKISNSKFNHIAGACNMSLPQWMNLTNVVFLFTIWISPKMANIS